MHETDSCRHLPLRLQSKRGILEQVRVGWHSVHRLGSQPGAGGHAHTTFPCHPPTRMGNLGGQPGGRVGSAQQNSARVRRPGIWQ